jgi:hypothetical protein
MVLTIGGWYSPDPLLDMTEEIKERSELFLVPRSLVKGASQSVDCSTRG